MQNVTDQLDIVYRMMSAFASSSDMSKTLHEGLGYIREQIGAEAASFFYLHEERDILRCEACIGPIDITGLEVPAGQGIVGAVTQSDEMRFVSDTAADADFSGVVDAKTGFETQSMICVPVSGNGKHYGALQLINRLDGRYFSESDAALVSVYGKSAALALANSHMAARMVEADTLQRDLQMASRVQENLFPATRLPFMYGLNIPKKGVSGDLFDYVERDAEIYFCMADVSGKGTDAALVMAKTHSLFRALSRDKPPVNVLAARINAELVETAFNGMFVTMILGKFDPETGAMQCCNAGHEPGLLLESNGAFQYVEASLQPLGILDFGPDDIVVETHNLTHRRFYCYSDGMTEAQINGTMLGATRLAAILSQQMDLPIAAQLENTVRAVREKTPELPDDLTILGLGHGKAQPMHTPTKTPLIETPPIEIVPVGEKLLFNISVVNDIYELRRLRREIENTLADTKARDIMAQVSLAVDEATQNIIRHAFSDGSIGTIQISGYLSKTSLYVSLRDNAPLIDLDKVKPRNLADLREGGLGTHFIMQLADKAHWSHDGDKNRLDLIFNLPA